jgi:hypothetical protein
MHALTSVRTTALVACAAGSAGCVVALPPTRTELGHSWRKNSSETQIAVGAHLASATSSEVRPEVGAGFMFETQSAGGDVKWRKGSYLDVGYAVLAAKAARVIVGVRGERHHDGDLHVAKLRVDAEFFGNVSGSGAEAGNCGMALGGAYGNLGLGVYAEGGRAFSTGDRMFEREEGWTATVGITMRAPAVAALFIGGKSSGCSGGDSSSGSSGGRFSPSSGSSSGR